MYLWIYLKPLIDQYIQVMKLHNCELEIQIENGLKIMPVTGKIEYFSMKISTKKLGTNVVSHKILYLFVTYFNDLPDAPGLLDPNIFADDNSSFHSEVSITACETISN